MSPITSAYLEQQLRRCMRPDAHLFVRPDWRRFVRHGFEDAHPFALYERKYSPDQPRVPAGDPAGGQWTSGGGEATTLSAASAKGHHYVTHQVFDNKKYNFPKETRKVLEELSTGKLEDSRSNKFDGPHRQYNKAVLEEFEKFKTENGIEPQRMTPDQARVFVKRILESTDPRIRTFNMAIHMREIRLKLLKLCGAASKCHECQ